MVAILLFADDFVKLIFLNKKMFYFYSHLTEICAHGSNKQHASIGLDNDLAPIRRISII